MRDTQKEREAICCFLATRLRTTLDSEPPMGVTRNDDRFRRYIRKIVTKISSGLYKVIQARASARNLYTYELRHGSRAETVFLGGADFFTEDVLWKELLVFFMNTDSTSGLLEFLRSLDPLDFDAGAAGDYLECFRSDLMRTHVTEELEELYLELENQGERLKLMGVIGNPSCSFDSPDSEDECSYDPESD